MSGSMSIGGIPNMLWLISRKDFCMYLALIFNSTVIEMCDDMFWISHGF
jgi:hypothetical protein